MQIKVHILMQTTCEVLLLVPHIDNKYEYESNLEVYKQVDHLKFLWIYNERISELVVYSKGYFHLRAVE